MSEIPKYVERLLERRAKLALDLMDTCHKIDVYCERIGVDLSDDSNCLHTNVMIYVEPWSAKKGTRRAIETALAERKTKR